MKRVLALAWFLLTLAPFAYMAYFTFFFAAGSSGSQSYEEAKAQFDFMFRLQFFVILGSWALVSSYVVYLFKTSFVPSEKRVL